MFKKFNLFLLIIMIFSLGSNSNAKYEKSAYDFNFQNIDGSPLKLSEYKGIIIVVNNVASQCGFTNSWANTKQYH